APVEWSRGFLALSSSRLGNFNADARHRLTTEPSQNPRLYFLLGCECFLVSRPAYAACTRKRLPPRRRQRYRQCRSPAPPRLDLRRVAHRLRPDSLRSIREWSRAFHNSEP